jgi:hypothetical protein
MAESVDYLHLDVQNTARKLTRLRELRNMFIKDQQVITWMRQRNDKQIKKEIQTLRGDNVQIKHQMEETDAKMSTLSQELMSHKLDTAAAVSTIRTEMAPAVIQDATAVVTNNIQTIVWETTEKAVNERIVKA